MVNSGEGTDSSERLFAWTGWDLRKRDRPAGGDLAPTAAKRTEQGPERNYELLAVAARGFRPPQFLQAREVSKTEADDLRAGETPVDPTGIGEVRLTWSVLYRRIAETRTESTELPFAIYLLGVNPPPQATADELAVFNDFYTNVHLREVAERRDALRAERYELEDELRAPYLGAPRFLATYEVDEVSASKRRHIGPPYTTGPEIWQQHKTPWRLWYRLRTAER